MVGTGAAATADAVDLTRSAAELGYAGALLLPPFYYKDLSDEGLFDFVARVADQTAHPAIALYLYNFPQMTGILWGFDLVQRLRSAFGSRIAGLKDSSGDPVYARSMSAVASDFAVFPSNEATLIEARSGAFAGCISATANLNAEDCARAFHDGDAPALEKANAIRALFNGRPLVAGVKAALASRYSDAAWLRVLPPLRPWNEEDRSELTSRMSSAGSSA
jgi:4-hydroxy-tetrahydrodipicolinate synthase